MPPDSKVIKKMKPDQRRRFEEDLKEQADLKKNPLVKKSGYTKWKPFHFMVYYDREKLVDQLL